MDTSPLAPRDPRDDQHPEPPSTSTPDESVTEALTPDNEVTAPAIPATELAPSAPSDAPATQPTLQHNLGPRLITRRNVLITGGSGLVVLTGAGVLAKHYGLIGRLRAKIDRHLGVSPLPTPHPHDLPTGPLSTPRDVVIFDGKLASGWQDWSWATHQLPNKGVTYDNQPTLSMDVTNWGGLQLITDAFDTTGLGYLQCFVRGADSGGQVINVTVLDDSRQWTGKATLGDYTQGGAIAQGTWRLARVPLSALGADSLNSTGVVLQAGAQQSQGTVDLANLRIVYHPDLTPPRVLRAWAYDLGTITLAFNEPMDPTSANVAAAYLLIAASGNGDNNYPPAHPVAAYHARYHSISRTVSLTVPQPLQRGENYTITLGPIVDKVGVKSLPGAQAHVQVTSQPLEITCDVSSQRRAISPDIYGMAGVDAGVAADLGVTLLRWGGNATTRYNWKLGNAFNAARDYNFENGNYGSTSAADRKPSGVADQTIAAAKAKNIGTLLTIPTIGWVARDDNNASHSTNVPSRGGPPTSTNGAAIDGYDPTANRQRTSVPSRARKGSPFSDPPDLSDPTVAQDEWIYHLTQRFGSTASGGVRYYAMDNEPDLWWITHTDVRPAQIGYDQMRDTFLDYATAIKSVDSTAQITGPVSWGWPNYSYSALDYGTDNYRTHADRDAHGGVPFLDWWLDAIHQHDQKAGLRTLDALDLHFYPQAGEYSDDTSHDMAALRLRSTRGLWDPSYTDESWIGEPVRLIPRMRDWVSKHYPGTRTALTEWSWGAEGSVNGALALAEILGIFGREGLDIACHWGGLDAKTPGYAAFKLYGNYDGAGSAFLGTSCAAISTKSDLLSCYAVQASNAGALLLMVINKSVDSDLTPTLRVANLDQALGGASLSRARVWRMWPDDAPGLTQGPTLDLSATQISPLSFTYTFPASSLTLLRLEAGA